MKSFTIVCMLALAAMAVARPEDHYTNQYDNMDLQLIFNNPRLMKSYVKCLLGTGKCTKEGNELKSHIAEALETNCKKCTEKQRDSTLRVVSFLIKNDPESWKQLQEKYDPKNQFATKYEAELKRIAH